MKHFIEAMIFALAWAGLFFCFWAIEYNLNGVGVAGVVLATVGVITSVIMFFVMLDISKENEKAYQERKARYPHLYK